MSHNNTILLGNKPIALSYLVHDRLSLVKSMEEIHNLALAVVIHSRHPTKHEDLLRAKYSK